MKSKDLIAEFIKKSGYMPNESQLDSLTGLLNREAVIKLIKAYFREEGEQGSHAMLIVDIDNFQSINDRLGHLFGDALLRELSFELIQVIHTGDLLGRIGGDEFIILLKNRNRDEAVSVAENICSIVRNVFANERGNCKISGSIGAAMFPADAALYAELFRKSDAALYGAKTEGKDGFRFYGDVAVQKDGTFGLMNQYKEVDPYEERHYANILLVTQIIELLLEGKSIDSSIMLILSMLGNYYKVSHACLMEDCPDEKCCKITYEWYMDEGEERMKTLNQISEQALRNYSKLFDGEGLFCCYDTHVIKSADEDVWTKVDEAGIKVLLQCALKNQGNFYGFISLDDFEINRLWSKEDINSFMLIGKTIGAYLDNLRAHQRSDRYANIDLLTGVWNIHKFSAEAGLYLKKEKKEFSAVITVDIRNFKYFNDQMGYEEGDRILLAFSRTVSESLHEAEMVARVSADQFVILINGPKVIELKYRIQKLVDSLSRVKLENSHVYKLTVIAGVYFIDTKDTSISAIMDRANLARKHMKHSHKSAVGYYNIHMERKILQEKNIEDTMEEALLNGELYVVYQPKVSFFTGCVTGAEALVRWKNAGMGIIYPDSFIPIVEKNGFVVEIDFFVLEQVCRKLQEWGEMGRKLSIAVNFSRMHIVNKGSISRALEILKRYEISPRNIEIEITESAFTDDYKALLQYADELGKAGFRIAMDDFGSGYSSLTMLKDLSIDVLKLDREFLYDGQITSRGRIIVSNIVSMAHQLGISIVAEGVETQEQAEFLASIDCEMAQGYFYAKPLDVNKFEQILRRGAVLP